MNTREPVCPDVIITAGGTREPIDDVRYVGNFSGGKLGHTLAETYAELGHHVLLLAPTSVVERFGRIPHVQHESFCSAADLEKKLLSAPCAQLVLHAAAVADYTPVRAEGKISSDKQELVIRMKRTGKILPKLREHFGPDTTIAGFKLLSGVAEDELIDVAARQIETCQTDLCIANDLQEIGSTRRLHIVSPDGSYQTVQGSTEDVAIEIAQHVPVRELSYV